MAFNNHPVTSYNRKAGVFTLQSADDRLKNRTQVKVGNNTILRRIGERGAEGTHFAIRLHATDIVTILPDGTYQLNMGGWNTVTTRDRLNTFSPASVGTCQNLPHVTVTTKPAVFEPEYVAGEYLSVPFVDGMRVNANGKPIGFDRRALARVEKARTDVSEMIRKYIRGFIDSAVKAKTLAHPSAGDCFGCQMRDVNAKGPAHTDPMGKDHYLAHFRERYYVPSLLFNAIRERGYRDPAFIWHFMARDIEAGKRSSHMSRDLRAFFRSRLEALAVELLSERGYKPDGTKPVQCS